MDSRQIYETLEDYGKAQAVMAIRDASRLDGNCRIHAVACDGYAELISFLDDLSFHNPWETADDENCSL